MPVEAGGTAMDKGTEQATETDWFLDAIRADGTALAAAARAAVRALAAEVTR